MSILKQSLAKEFEVKDLGLFWYFPIMEVARSKKGILGDVQDGILVDLSRYPRPLGKFIYLSHTCPDISSARSTVSQFMHCPYGEQIENSLIPKGTSRKKVSSLGKLKKKELRYILMMIGLKINIRILHLPMGKSCVTWRSKKQNVVTRMKLSSNQ
ncbi:hypothetical protein CR513_00868, partial [Mucuna pruriens]